MKVVLLIVGEVLLEDTISLTALLASLEMMIKFTTWHALMKTAEER